MPRGPEKLGGGSQLDKVEANNKSLKAKSSQEAASILFAPFDSVWEKTKSAFDAFDVKEKIGILKAAQESLNLTPQQELRVAQLDILKRLFESLKEDVKKSRSSKEWHYQFWVETGEETEDRRIKLEKAVKHLEMARVKIAKSPQMTLDQAMGSFVKDIAGHYELGKKPEFSALFDASGRLKDVSNHKGVQEQYSALIEVLRWRGDYNRARLLVEEHLFSEQFDAARAKIDKNENHRRLTHLKAKAIKRIDNQLRRSGDKVPKSMRDAVIDLQYKRMVNKDFVEQMIASKDLKFDGAQAKIMSQYADMMGAGDFDIADSTWDLAIKEICVSLPLIAASFGTAMVGRVALSATARMIISMSPRLSRAFGLAEGTMHQVSKTVFYGKRIADGLATGAMFSIASEGFEGKNLFSGGLKKAPDWLKKIFYNSVGLGALKLVGGGSKSLAAYLTKSMTSVENPLVEKLVQHAFSVNLEAGTLFSLGVAQHYLETGEHPEFLDVLLHSYVAIGAIKLASSGSIEVAGRVFKAAEREIKNFANEQSALEYFRVHGASKGFVTAIMPIMLGTAAIASEYRAVVGQRAVATLQMKAAKGAPKKVDGKFLQRSQKDLFAEMTKKGVSKDKVAELKELHDQLPAEAKPFVKIWSFDGQTPYVVIDQDAIEKFSKHNHLQSGLISGFVIAKIFSFLVVNPALATFRFLFKRGGRLAGRVGEAAVSDPDRGDPFDTGKLPKVAEILEKKQLKKLSTKQKGELETVINIASDILGKLGVSGNARPLELVKAIVRARYIKMRMDQIEASLPSAKPKAKAKLSDELKTLRTDLEALTKVMVEGGLDFVEGINKAGTKRLKRTVKASIESEFIKDGAPATSSEVTLAVKEANKLIDIIGSQKFSGNERLIADLEFKAGFWHGKAQRAIAELSEAGFGNTASLADKIARLDAILARTASTPSGLSRAQEIAFLKSRMFLESYRAVLKQLKTAIDARGLTKWFNLAKRKLPNNRSVYRVIRAAAIIALIFGVGYGGCSALSNMFSDKPVPRPVDPNSDPYIRGGREDRGGPSADDEVEEEPGADKGVVGNPSADDEVEEAPEENSGTTGETAPTESGGRTPRTTDDLDFDL